MTYKVSSGTLNLCSLTSWQVNLCDTLTICAISSSAVSSMCLLLALPFVLLTYLLIAGLAGGVRSSCEAGTQR